MKLNTLKDKVAAGGARLNAAVAANGQQLRNRLMDLSSDDEEGEESSDEESEELWNSTIPSSTTPSATAIAIRNQPAVNFVKPEEEDRIRAELKDAKGLRKKLRKVKKLVKRSMKATQSVHEAADAAATYFHATASDRCTDAIIIEMAARAERVMQEYRQTPALANFNTHVTDQILEQVKPINDHAKLVSVTGKERRSARDRRIRMALGQVDVTNEAEYNKSVDVVHDFEEKDSSYKDAYVSFREHNSSQLGQMMRCYLLETAACLEGLAAALRESAGSSAGNYFLSDDCCTKFKDFKVDPHISAPAPPLFSHLKPDGGLDDRLTAKPVAHAAPQAAVAGIPMTAQTDGAHKMATAAEPAAVVVAPPEEPEEGRAASHREAEQYGASSYTRHSAPDTATRRSIDQFLLTGQLPATENSRARPTSAFGDAAADAALMDYIRALALEYGIEPDFSVRRGRAEGLRRAVGVEGEGEGEDGVAGTPTSVPVSRPSNSFARPKSMAPHNSLILPSLTDSVRGPSASPNAPSSVRSDR